MKSLERRFLNSSEKTPQKGEAPQTVIPKRLKLPIDNSREKQPGNFGRKLALNCVFGVILALVVSIFFIFNYKLIFIASFFFFITIWMIFVVIFITAPDARILTDPKPRRFPSLTILIPAHNEEKAIAKSIGAVKSMKYPRPFEIIVLNDGSTDRTGEIAGGIDGVKVLAFDKKMGKARSLNKGIDAAKGELVTTIDADTYPSKDALLKMVGHFGDPKVGAVVTLVTVKTPSNFLQKIQYIEYYIAFGFWHKALSIVDGLHVTPGPMSIYRKSALLEAGKFDEDNITEDMEIAFALKKAGYRIECSVNTRVETDVPDTLSGYLRQRLRWYRGSIYNLLVKHRDMIFNRSYGTFGMLVVPQMVATMIWGTVLTVGAISLSINQTAISAATLLSEIMHGGFTIDFSWLKFDPLNMPAYLIFTVLSGLVFSYLLFMSLSMDAKRKPQIKFYHIALYLLFYSVMISLAYMVSIYKEFVGDSRTW